MASKNKHQRSWKNYLLDSNYQLRFTFTMLAIAAGLMAPLGWWVSVKASRATEVALNQIDGVRCPEIPSATAPKEPPIAPGEVEEDLLNGTVDDEVGNGEALEDEAELGESEKPAVEEADEVAEEKAEPGDGKAEAEEVEEAKPEGDAVEGDGVVPEDGERRPRAPIKVDIDDSDMPTEPVVSVGELVEAPATPEEIKAITIKRESCLAENAKKKASVRDRQSLISLLMVVFAIVLLIGLGVYGITTTHHVAGPLFKVGLYLQKLEKNVYDTVYDLRKGDQLIEFYKHFKGAHQGLTTMQEEDRDRLRDALALAKDAGLADKSPELAAVIEDLERLLAEKEESLA